MENPLSNSIEDQRECASN